MLAERSRQVRDGIKNDTGGIIALAARRIRERWPIEEFEEFLGPDVWLVPAPRSAPLKDVAALWPARRVADEFVSKGHGDRTATLLRRLRPVQKSAFAGKGQRPTPLEHLGTIVSESVADFPPARVTVVDDFVTTGATLLACASHLSANWPGVDVRCFGLVRTANEEETPLQRLDLPTTGEIKYHVNSGRTSRRP